MMTSLSTSKTREHEDIATQEFNLAIALLQSMDHLKSEPDS
jgi:hypothetical protein